MDFLPWLISALVSALLTFSDLDRTFYIPKSSVEKRINIYLWFSGFILLNSGLAMCFYAGVKDISSLQNMPAWLVGMGSGVSYLALVRSKFTTIKINESEIPFGIDLFYESVKGIVYENINNLAKEARREEIIAKVDDEKETLEKLNEAARVNIYSDALLSAKEKQEKMDWLNSLDKNEKGEREKRILLVTYLLTNQTESL